MDEALAALTREWLVKARNDLENARIVRTVPEGPLDTAIYHCQQAAEKAVKAWLTATDTPFEKTHDVVRLVREAADIDSRFQNWFDAAEVLTPYASAFRYPGLAGEAMPTPTEFDQAFAQATAIWQFVNDLLPQEARVA